MIIPTNPTMRLHTPAPAKEGENITFIDLASFEINYLTYWPQARQFIVGPDLRPRGGTRRSETFEDHPFFR